MHIKRATTALRSVVFIEILLPTLEAEITLTT